MISRAKIYFSYDSQIRARVIRSDNRIAAYAGQAIIACVPVLIRIARHCGISRASAAVGHNA